MGNLNFKNRGIYIALMLCGVGLILAAITAGFLAFQKAQSPKTQNQAYFPVRNCINVAGSLESPIEGEWGYKISHQDLENIKSHGFDTIRLTINWSAHTQNTAPFLIDGNFLNRIDEIVDWSNELGLITIIDVHNFEELYENPDANEPRLIAIWALIAQHYKDQPQSLIFEIINEPRDKFSGRRVNQTQNLALAEIRKTNPSRTVIYSGDEWGGISGMDNIILPQDPYLVATVHYYNPFEFTHQGAEFLGKDAPPAGRIWPMGDDIEKLDKDIKRIKDFQTRINAPVFVGEYGATIEIPMQYRAAWTFDVAQRLKAANLTSCYFNYKAGFSAYDMQSQKWYPPILEALGHEQ